MGEKTLEVDVYLNLVLDPEGLEEQILAFHRTAGVLRESASEEDLAMIDITGEILKTIANAAEEAMKGKEDSRKEVKPLNWLQEQVALIDSLNRAAELVLKDGNTDDHTRIKHLLVALQGSLDDECAEFDLIGES